MATKDTAAQAAEQIIDVVFQGIEALENTAPLSEEAAKNRKTLEKDILHYQRFYTGADKAAALYHAAATKAANGEVREIPSRNVAIADGKVVKIDRHSMTVEYGPITSHIPLFAGSLVLVKAGDTVSQGTPLTGAKHETAMGHHWVVSADRFVGARCVGEVVKDSKNRVFAARVFGTARIKGRNHRTLMVCEGFSAKSAGNAGWSKQVRGFDRLARLVPEDYRQEVLGLATAKVKERAKTAGQRFSDAAGFAMLPYIDPDQLRQWADLAYGPLPA